ncbi:hydrogenase maturation nickel metallochaperone HypA [Saccharopolyspora rhizosphaerae]|uniref:Hydrogenase maturation factor HypA n=1 Tax=Saccharopolyspora rhizosphaerae TaxID=2492662 RepID=A0A3R8P391_9PSEU|nr:hydrogenase maturation nickel metallochaperone HypA [Saccharopolyspora rhizosphaerae]RRO18655.1 hydrogenase maturation nickel metallochaperone HypA [Saccharopolyspora rhizosphaerae]
MHELAITESIVSGVVERMGSTRIASLQLEIGALSGVVADSVRFCFELVAEGTTVQGARLDIDEPRGRIACARCRSETEINGPVALCPCGNADVELLAGTELRIRSVEVM